jgi:Na+/proline symporter
MTVHEIQELPEHLTEVHPTTGEIQIKENYALRKRVQNLPSHMIRHDMAYPAMLTFLPSGLAGLVLASLFAAYMSTTATHLNLGSSYMVNDFYRRFINPNASEKRFVFMGRMWTVLFMIMACVLALQLSSALDAFHILLQIGAGTGLLFLLRWFWWRINAWSEIAAMSFAFPVALYFKLNIVGYDSTLHELFMKSLFGGSVPAALNFSDSMQLVIGVSITTLGWVVVTLLTPPDDEKVLREFLRKSRAGGPGWKNVIEKAKAEGDVLGFRAGYKWPVPFGILCALFGCASVYCALFATWLFLYGQIVTRCILIVVSIVSAVVLFASWDKIAGDS